MDQNSAKVALSIKFQVLCKETAFIGVLKQKEKVEDAEIAKVEIGKDEQKIVYMKQPIDSIQNMKLVEQLHYQKNLNDLKRAEYKIIEYD